jgi:hypothetical protein
MNERINATRITINHRLQVTIDDNLRDEVVAAAMQIEAPVEVAAVVSRDGFATICLLVSRIVGRYCKNSKCSTLRVDFETASLSTECPRSISRWVQVRFSH